MTETRFSAEHVAEAAAFEHPDHLEGAVLVTAPYPPHLRGQVVLDCFDSDVKDGDSEAAYSFKYGEEVGEIFHGESERVISGSRFWEVYPHSPDNKPVLFYNPDPEDEVDFLRDAVLQTLGVTRD